MFFGDQHAPGRHTVGSQYARSGRHWASGTTVFAIDVTIRTAISATSPGRQRDTCLMRSSMKATDAFMSESAHALAIHAGTLTITARVLASGATYSTCRNPVRTAMATSKESPTAANIYARKPSALCTTRG